jgi:small subunit ribosomal protein S21
VKFGGIMAKEPNVRIVVGKDENIEKALKKFKRLCERAGIKKEVRSRRYYEKPSEKRRKAIRKAERNRRKPKYVKDAKSENPRARNRNWIFSHPKILDENK